MVELWSNDCRLVWYIFFFSLLCVLCENFELVLKSLWNQISNYSKDTIVNVGGISGRLEWCVDVELSISHNNSPNTNCWNGHLTMQCDTPVGEFHGIGWCKTLRHSQKVAKSIEVVSDYIFVKKVVLKHRQKSSMAHRMVIDSDYHHIQIRKAFRH